MDENNKEKKVLVFRNIAMACGTVGGKSLSVKRATLLIFRMKCILRNFEDKLCDEPVIN